MKSIYNKRPSMGVVAKPKTTMGEKKNPLMPRGGVYTPLGWDAPGTGPRLAVSYARPVGGTSIMPIAKAMTTKAAAVSSGLGKAIKAISSAAESKLKKGKSAYSTAARMKKNA